MDTKLLCSVSPKELSAVRKGAFDEETLREALSIVEDVRQNGLSALIEQSKRFGEFDSEAKVVRSRAQLEDALRALPEKTRELLKRTAGRIRAFAEVQRQTLTELQVELPGGFAGHRLDPVDCAGCYAPGGRFPLPSSVLMTAVTARAAGVEEVWVASPRPTEVTLAAAAVAGADALLACGGAHAIAALAYGVGPVPKASVVVGPGNRWVTAAKYLVSKDTAIDMLAGPTELVLVADSSADPKTAAADLLAQAEHDDDALPVLVSLDQELIDRVREELEDQLRDLPTAETARAALKNGFSVFASDMQQAVEVCDVLAPEHLQLSVDDAHKYSRSFRNYGALFVGHDSAEVFCDYGAGPNHVLPTGGTARYAGGLSVFNFLRVRTWLRITDREAAAEFAEDAKELALLEGLHAHSRAADRRRR